MEKKVYQKIALLSFLIGLFCTSHASFADTYYVDAVKGVNISDAEKTVAQELVKNAVQQMTEHVVSDTPVILKLKPKVIKLGDSYLFSVEKWRNATKVASAQTKTKVFSEADTAFARITRQAIAEQNSSEADRVDEVSSSEVTSGTLRKEPTQDFYVGFGPGVGHNLSNSAMLDITVGAGFNLNPHFTLRPSASVIVSVGSKKSAYLLDAGLEGQYYLLNRSISPFVGALIGYGFADRDDSSGLGNFIVGASAGYRFFRTSRVNLSIELNYKILTQSFANNSGIPGAASLRVGLYF